VDKTERLRQLHDLKTSGILSDDEFNIEKNKILNEGDLPPVVIPPPPPPPEMMQSGPPPLPPPLKQSDGNNTLRTVILCVGGVIAICILLSPVILYVWAASFLEQGESAPIATFWVDESSSGIYYVEVTKVSKEESLISFSFFLKDEGGSVYVGGNGFGEIAMQRINGELHGIDTSYMGDSELQERADNVDNDDGSEYPVHFSDDDRDGMLSAGDTFKVYGQGNSANGPAKDGWKLDIQFDPSGDIIGSAKLL